MEKYVLSAAPPTRAMAITAVADLAGAVLIVLGVDRGNTALFMIGIAVFVLGAGVATAAILLGRRLRTEVVLTETGIEISSSGRTARADWSQVTGVSRNRNSIYLDRKQPDAPALKIDSPRGASDPQFQRLGELLAERLDQDRGYRSL